MPLHLKPSGQSGIEGSPVFDPVGTNKYIKRELMNVQWKANIPIPKIYRFLGTDVDFGKKGILVEAQFSHYSFLLNNVIRSELFFNTQTTIIEENTQLLMIVTKSKMFPAANSSLYYEQAVHQLRVLSHLLKIPIRLVGLFEDYDTTTSIKWTVYQGKTSRDILTQTDRQCQISSSISPQGRPKITLI